ncbi:hypothetical protein ABDK00_006070 [Niabella insulamsoli]|uniref:hypothetical protein n=1 Tax=Niabella insulamsoli TaxID=3144874 RepID=UPI0031FC895A
MSRLLRYISGCFLSALLLLLTIGLPISYNAIMDMKSSTAQTENCNKNPYSNATEEKTPSNTLTISEEYVHEDHSDVQLPLQQISIAYIHAHEATYVAYHGELHCPPPNS